MARTLGLAVGMAGGDTVAGVGVDWSKCYGHIPLSLLRKIAELAGLLGAVWRPMVAAYTFPRQVKSDGLAGEPGAPSRGLAPGCPAATDWMALLMYCWRRKAERLCPEAQARAYVDDLTAHVTAPPLSAIAVATQREAQLREFGESLGLVINETKSVRFAPIAEARIAMAETPGLPVTEAFKDLGVDQQVGARRLVGGCRGESLGSYSALPTLCHVGVALESPAAGCRNFWRQCPNVRFRRNNLVERLACPGTAGQPSRGPPHPLPGRAGGGQLSARRAVAG